MREMRGHIEVAKHNESFCATRNSSHYELALETFEESACGIGVPEVDARRCTNPLHDGEPLSRWSTTYWLDVRIFSQRAVNWNRADWSHPSIGAAAELLAKRVRSMGLRSCGRHCCPRHRPLLLEAVAGLIAGAASYYALSIVSGLKRRVRAT
jgi:hypothetical protein